MADIGRPLREIEIDPVKQPATVPDTAPVEEPVKVPA